MLLPCYLREERAQPLVVGRLSRGEENSAGQGSGDESRAYRKPSKQRHHHIYGPTMER